MLYILNTRQAPVIDAFHLMAHAEENGARCTGYRSEYHSVKPVRYHELGSSECFKLLFELGEAILREHIMVDAHVRLFDAAKDIVCPIINFRAVGIVHYFFAVISQA